MARSELTRRVDALEVGKADAFQGPAIWVVRDPGESAEDAIARYEAKHGLRQPGQPAVIWRTVETGVPRGVGSICA